MVAFFVLREIDLPGQVDDLRERAISAIGQRLGAGSVVEGLDFDLETATVTIDRLATSGEPASSDIGWEIESVRIPLDPAALLHGSLVSEAIQLDRVFLHVTPQLSILVSDVRGNVSAESSDTPVEIDLAGALDGDGRLRCVGTIDRSGVVSLRSEIENAPVGPLGALFPQWRRIAGRVTGSVDLSGPVGAPDRLDADLSFEGVQLDAVKLQLDEELDLRAQLANLVGSRGPGTFEIDATGARMRYGDSYEKLPGKSAHVTGNVVRLPDGVLDLADMHLRIGK